MRGVLDAARTYLERQGVDSPRLDSEVLLAHSLGLRRLDLYLQFDRPLSEPERAPFRELLRRRGAREPVAYLTGLREFFSLAFEVNPAVLIPRPETEEVVQAAIDLAGGDPPAAFVDLCTGSGCVAVSLLKAWQQARAVVTDTSAAALACAKRNAARHGVAARLACVRTDLGTALGGPALEAVVANPPYVAAPELAGLAPEIRRFEPNAALLSGDDGLLHSRQIAAWLGLRLARRGFAVIECADARGEETRAIFAQALPGHQVSLRTDLSGRPRVVVVSPGVGGAGGVNAAGTGARRQRGRPTPPEKG